jgi:Zn-dependent protease with chaperone function
VLTRVRAVVALGLLAGFFVIVAVTVLGLAVLGRYIGGSWGALAVTVALVAGGAVVVALMKVLRLPEDTSGLVLSPTDAPELWGTVRALAAQVGTRPPDTIRLVPEVNAAVSERGRLLGLLSGHRTLLVGLPLMQAFTADQLRAVLAHEMGHYSHSHTRLGPITYRGRVTMCSVIAHVGPHNLVGLLFSAYARLYFLVEAAVSRRQELEADCAAARAAGRDAAISALSDLTGLQAAWQFFLDRCVGSGWRSGCVPDTLFAGFQDLLQAGGAAVTSVRSQATEPLRSRWDTHPPIQERVALLAAMPADGASSDHRPATCLLPNLDAATRRLEALLVNRDGMTTVTWEEYVVRAARAQLRSDAEHLLGRFARETGQRTVTAAQFIDAATPGVAVEQVMVLIMACAVRSGVAHWQQSWTQAPALLLRTDGQPLDARAIARQLLDPATSAAARNTLRSLGIELDLTWEERADDTTTNGSRVVAVIANVVVDGARRDLILYDTGLLVVPAARRGQMRQSLSRLQTMATESTLAELRSNAGTRFVPRDDVVACAPTRKPLLAHVVALIGLMGIGSGGAAFAFALTRLDGSVVNIRWGTETVFLGSSSAHLTHYIDELTQLREPVGTR